MMKSLFIDMLLTSITTSVVILGLVILSPLMSRRYFATWAYWIWLIIAVRLLLPFNFSFNNHLIELPLQLSGTVMTENNLQNMPVNTNTETIVNTVPAEQVLASGSQLPSFFDIVVWIWLMGLAVFLLYHFASYLYFRKQALRWSYPIMSEKHTTKIKQVFEQMNVTKDLPVFTSDRVPNPMLVGFKKQILFLPHERYTEEELEFILKHELVHHQRKDILYKLLLLVVQAIHWFNPFVWLMVREAHLEIEMSCDQTVVKNQSLNYRKRYCEAILSAIQHQDTRQLPLSTSFSGRTDSIMKKRFNSILSMKERKRGIVPFSIVLILISGLAILVACTGISNTNSDSHELIREIIHEHLGVTPYVPETEHELGTVLLEYHPQFGSEEKEPLKATISYFESLDELEKADEEMVEWFEENDPLGRDLLYGDLYPQGRIIFIEIYPGRIEMGDEEVEDINVLGHDIQYVYYEKGGGRDLDMVMMTINFDDVGYSIEYLNRGQSDNIEEEAKRLAEDIIKNNL